MFVSFAIVDCLLAMPHWAAQFDDPIEREWFRYGLAAAIADGWIIGA
jgi:hypothetical protein